MGSKRLDWIDIAKGIAIILAIVGHTVPNPSPLQHAIFSFHMLVFFILLFLPGIHSGQSRGASC